MFSFILRDSELLREPQEKKITHKEAQIKTCNLKREKNKISQELEEDE